MRNILVRILLRVLQRAGWSWMELGATLGARFSNTQFEIGFYELMFL